MWTRKCIHQSLIFNSFFWITHSFQLKYRKKQLDPLGKQFRQKKGQWKQKPHFSQDHPTRWKWKNDPFSIPPPPKRRQRYESKTWKPILANTTTNAKTDPFLKPRKGNGGERSRKPGTHVRRMKEKGVGSTQTLTRSDCTEPQKRAEKEELHCPNQIHWEAATAEPQKRNQHSKHRRESCSLKPYVAPSGWPCFVCTYTSTLTPSPQIYTHRHTETIIY